MDIKGYYQKVKEVAQSLSGDYVVIVSRETPDGGKAGVKMEVSRSVAAKMIVGDKARIADKVESAAFHKEMAERKRLAEQAAASAKLQLTVLAESELRELKTAVKARKRGR
ncbi:MAG: hypothetical protein HY235_01175 [Acidobacteria bacterium]|nr:hypothetical protein [Acidobacteriota bacterium]